jgi:uncharacterized protein YlxP (DUF503 family)
MAIHVGLLVITFEIPAANSLKEKRSVIKHIIEKAKRNLHAAISEVGFQNKIRSAQIAATFVGPQRNAIERAREHAESLLETEPRIRIIETTWQWL